MGPALPALAQEVARRLPLSEAVKAGADAASASYHLSPAVAHLSVSHSSQWQAAVVSKLTDVHR